MTTYSFTTVRTVVSTREGSESTNSERLGYRHADLQAAGDRGFELLNTVTIQTGEFITIADTLQKTNEED